MSKETRYRNVMHHRQYPLDVFLSNHEVRNFFLKYNQTDPPEALTFRKNYLPKCYEETLNKILVLCGK
jgi:hypothetical protein